MDLLILIIALVVYGPAALLLLVCGWMLHRRRRRWAAFAGVLLLGYCGMLAHHGAVPGFDWYHDRGFTRQVFGTSFGLGRAVTVHEEPRSWHGDGYSVWVHRLPERISEVVRRHPEQLRGYPRNSLRPEWRVQPWTSARSSAMHREYLTWAISPAPEPLEAEIEAVLAKPGTWYSFLVYKNGEYINNMDLFVVDPTTNRFYVINHNT